MMAQQSTTILTTLLPIQHLIPTGMQPTVRTGTTTDYTLRRSPQFSNFSYSKYVSYALECHEKLVLLNIYQKYITTRFHGVTDYLTPLTPSKPLQQSTIYNLQSTIYNGMHVYCYSFDIVNGAPNSFAYSHGWI